jgi:molybdate/tungstate transport system substrate-binding protein
MRPVAQTALVAVVIAVVGVAGFLAGWYLAPSGHSSSSSTSSSTLSLIAAGTLAPILPGLATQFANATPGVQAPSSAQLYEGSSAAATTLAGGNQPYDVFVAADFRTIPKSLFPPTTPIATWEVVFAADPVVLAYAPSVTALNGINSNNWASKVVQSGVLLGAPNASSDPLGYNAIFTLELEDAALGLGGSLYHHFFNGAVGAFATPTSATLYVSENVAATALSSGEVDAFLIYRSYAVVDHLAYVNLSPGVNLGETDSASVATYATAVTTILSGTSTKSVSGAPVLFALTVPSSASSVPLGIAFSAFLLSNATAATWAADGFAPLAPLWATPLGSVPAALSGSPPSGTAALPSYLQSLT